MTERHGEELTPRRAWLLGLADAGRALLTVGVLLGLYYVVPFDEPFGVSLVVGLVVVLALLTALGIFAVRGILRSPLPRMKAIEALTTLIPLLLIAFAVAYYLISEADASNFSEPLTRTDALYFVLTVFSTVGFGDITATSQSARSVVNAQIVVNLVVIGLGLRIIVGAVEHGRARAEQSDADPTPPGRSAKLAATVAAGQVGSVTVWKGSRSAELSSRLAATSRLSPSPIANVAIAKSSPR